MTAGPLCHATLIVGDVRPLVAAYGALGLVVAARAAVSPVSQKQALAWGQAKLAGAPCVELALHADAAPLLRLIELPGTPPRPTRFSYGWMALEILVRDVDAMAARFPINGFEIVGAPADLDVSPHIRAMQVVGPAGEMLYLTQIKAPVPPFDVPLSASLTGEWGPLFIGVMSTPSRDAVLHACAPLAPRAQLRFDTKITVLNRALGRALDTRWPVATAQFAGASLFEIDEVVDAQVAAPGAHGELPAGLAWLTMAGAAGDSGDGHLLEISPGAWLEVLSR
jgi:hypothetical protein